MKRLATHLEPLKRNGTIELWYDRMIEPGTKWDDSIKEEMRSADVIIFLLTPIAVIRKKNQQFRVFELF